MAGSAVGSTPAVRSGERRSNALARLDRWIAEEGGPSDSDLLGLPEEPTQRRPARRRRDLFEVSVADFATQARAEPWGFWRGVMLGFCAGVTLTYAAVMGEPLFRIG